MKFVTEFRAPELCRALQGEIDRTTTRSWNLMEICGGQTHSILRHGLDQMLPQEENRKIDLIHGPGCPVCVTPVTILDQAMSLAKTSSVILCTYGDMLRVPGTSGDLQQARAQGADIRIVYSPLESLKIAEDNPQKEIIFLAVGFETTAPAHGFAVYEAERRKLRNFSLLCSHVLVPPALRILLRDQSAPPADRIHGLLAAGHVCTVMGIKEYEELSNELKIPIIITGFEPVDLLQGIQMCVRQLERQEFRVENQYARSVRPQGNLAAQKILETVYEVADQEWRGLGVLPMSGLQLRKRYAQYDARLRLKVVNSPSLTKENPSKENPRSACCAGLVLQGKMKPPQCPLFGKPCTPENPLGATMVSAEGACAAYFHYRNTEPPAEVL